MQGSIIVLLLASLVAVGQCTLCYICSWSPEDNRTDTCSGDHWKVESAGQIDCHTGCESVTQLDNNGVISMFHRNCANQAVPRSSQCHKQPFKAGNRRVCSCNTHLCNAATPTSKSILITLSALLVFTAFSNNIL